jgi:hypothetical protein
MLSKAGAAAAVAAVAAGTLLSPRRAEAADRNFDTVNAKRVNSDNSAGEPAILAFSSTTIDDTGTVTADNTSSGPGVLGLSVEGHGVEGLSQRDGSEGVYGTMDASAPATGSVARATARRTPGSSGRTIRATGGGSRGAGLP